MNELEATNLMLEITSNGKTKTGREMKITLRDQFTKLIINQVTKGESNFMVTIGSEKKVLEWKVDIECQFQGFEGDLRRWTKYLNGRMKE